MKRLEKLCESLPADDSHEVLGLIRFLKEARVFEDCLLLIVELLFEPVHEISNNVVCAISKGSDQPAHTRSLIRAFARCLNIL